MQRMYQDLLTVILYICGIQRTFETIMRYMKVKHQIRMSTKKGLAMNGFNKK